MPILQINSRKQVLCGGQLFCSILLAALSTLGFLWINFPGVSLLQTVMAVLVKLNYVILQQVLVYTVAKTWVWPLLRLHKWWSSWHARTPSYKVALKEVITVLECLWEPLRIRNWLVTKKRRYCFHLYVITRPVWSYMSTMARLIANYVYTSIQ